MARFFIRFVSGKDYDDDYWSTGVVHCCRELIDDGKLEPWAEAEVETIFDTLNENLPCPPFKKNLSEGKWTSDAVSWFKDSAKDHIAQVRALAEILGQQGYPTRMLRTDKPGMILYEDEFQIIAQISRRIKAI